MKFDKKDVMCILKIKENQFSEEKIAKMIENVNKIYDSMVETPEILEFYKHFVRLNGYNVMLYVHKFREKNIPFSTEEAFKSQEIMRAIIEYANL